MRRRNYWRHGAQICPVRTTTDRLMVHGRGNAACLVWYPGATIVVAIRDLDGIGGEKRQLANEHTPSLAIRECDRIRINKLRGWCTAINPSCLSIRPERDE